MSAHVPLRTWFNSQQAGFCTGQGLVIEPTELAEQFVDLWVAVDGDGPAVALTANQCREIAAELEKRADLIEPLRPIPAEIVEEDGS